MVFKFLAVYFVIFCNYLNNCKAHHTLPPLDECPEVPSKTNFEASKISGKWYVDHSLSPFPEEELMECTTITLEFKPRHNVDITVEYKFPNNETHYHKTVKAFNSKKEGKLKAVYRKVRFSGIIVDTDYTRFMTAYSCSLTDPSKQYVVVLRRKRAAPLKNSFIQRIEKKFRKYGIDTTALLKVKQKNCH